MPGTVGGGVPAPGGVPGGDPPGRLLLRAVRILLEYILVEFLIVDRRHDRDEENNQTVVSFKIRNSKFD